MATAVLASAAVRAAGSPVETFAPPPGRWLGYAGIAGTLIFGGSGAIADPGQNLWMVYAAVIASAAFYVALVRPTVTAGRDGLLMKNMLRDTCVPWALIERARVSQTLQVATAERDVFHGLGATRSARSMMREQRRSAARRSGRPVGGLSLFGGGGMSTGEDRSGYPDQQQLAGSYTDYIETRIMQLAGDAAHRNGTTTSAPMVSWAAVPVAVLGLVVLMVLLLAFT